MKQQLPLQVGNIVHGFAQGIFGRDHYSCSRVEAIGEDWVIVRHLDDEKACCETGDHIVDLCIESRDESLMHTKGCPLYQVEW